MNRFINIVIGWIGFACIIILARTGRMLEAKAAQPDNVLNDYIFIGLIVASIFFLQYAVERYLIPPNVFTREQKKRMLEGSEDFYRKTFFRGAIGISYLFLVWYAVDYLTPKSFGAEKIVNFMTYSLFFLIFGLLARARAIILHLATPAALSAPLVEARTADK